MKKIVLVLFGLLIHFTILAQQKSDKIAPAWMNGDMPTQMNNSYWFKVTYGEGKTLSEARHNATLSLLGDLIKSKGITVSGNEVEKILSINTNDAYAETVKREHSYNIEFAENKFSFFAADEYWTKSKEEYICYVLFEIANNPQSVNFDKINFTTNYGASAFLRSCIVPGWGQMYKKQKDKGIAILSTESMGISGIIVAENIHKEEKKKGKGDKKPKDGGK